MIFNYIVGTFQGTRDIEENRRLEVNFRDSKLGLTCHFRMYSRTFSPSGLKCFHN